MRNDIELHYFFDPLCGWCYASAPALKGLAERFADNLRMSPSGLFVGGRPVSSIADHAWRNDQRIEALTGQRFSEDYHRNVLLAPNGIFDSKPATLALAALGGLDPKLEPRFLHAVQIARYVDGRDTSKFAEVAKVATQVAMEHGILFSAKEFEHRLRTDEDLRERTLERIEDTQKEMDLLGIRGVPQLVVLVNGHPQFLDGEALYSGPDRLIAAITELPTAA